MLALDVAAGAEAAVAGDGIGAGVGDDTIGLDAQHAVGDARHERLVRRGHDRELAAHEHLGEDLRGLHVVLLERAGGAHAHLVGVALDDGDGPVVPEDRDGPHVDGDAGRQRVVAGLGDLVGHEGDGDLMVGLVFDEFAHDVLLEGRGASHGPHLGGAGEDVSLVGEGLPEDEIGEAEVGEHLPTGEEGLQPLFIRHDVNFACHGPHSATDTRFGAAGSFWHNGASAENELLKEANHG